MVEIARLERCLCSGVLFCTVPRAAAVVWLFGVAPQGRGGAAGWPSCRVRRAVRVACDPLLGGFKTAPCPLAVKRPCRPALSRPAPCRAAPCRTVRSAK